MLVRLNGWIVEVSIAIYHLTYLLHILHILCTYIYMTLGWSIAMLDSVWWKTRNARPRSPIWPTPPGSDVPGLFGGFSSSPCLIFLEGKSIHIPWFYVKKWLVSHKNWRIGIPYPPIFGEHANVCCLVCRWVPGLRLWSTAHSWRSGRSTLAWNEGKTRGSFGPEAADIDLIGIKTG